MSKPKFIKENPGTPEAVAMQAHRETMRNDTKPRQLGKGPQLRRAELAVGKAEIERTLNDNTPEKPLAKVVCITKDLLTWREQPITEPYVEQLCNALMTWLDKNPDAIMIQEFLLDRHMSYMVYHNLRKQHPRLQETHDFAMMTFGVRREKGAVNKKYDASMVQFMQPKYDQEWREMNEWRMEEKAKAQAKAQAAEQVNIRVRDMDVFMPDFGDDDRVPARVGTKRNVVAIDENK